MPDNSDPKKRMIRSWCVAAGKTYPELADDLNIPLARLKGWIYGRNSISLTNATIICDYFDKSLDELCGRREYSPKIGR